MAEPEPEPEPEPGSAEDLQEASLGKAETRELEVEDERQLTLNVNIGGGDALRNDVAAARHGVALPSELVKELPDEEGAEISGVGWTTELRVDPVLLDLDEEESKRAVSRQARSEKGFFGVIRQWWAHRQETRNKAHGMDPYIRARLGKHGSWARTSCVLSTKRDGPDIYTNPRFNDTHNRLLRLKRSKADGGELIIEAMDDQSENDRFIGGCHVHLSEFIRFAEQTTDWKHTVFHLYDKQEGKEEDPMAEERDAGGVHALVRWVPEVDERGMWILDDNRSAKGELEIKVMTATGLRDISEMKISDIGSFADKTALQIATAIMVLCMMVSVVYYRYVVWQDVDWGARGTEYPLIDTLLFVTNTLTTVGYGKHAGINTSGGRLATAIYVIVSIGILGVFLGAVGDVVQSNLAVQKKKKQLKKLKEMEDKGEDTSNFTEDDHQKITQEAQENMDRRKAERAQAGEAAEEQDEAAEQQAMQQEIARVLERHFWIDEAKKAGLGFSGLLATIALGTVIFVFSEQQECFSTRLGKERAEELLGTLPEESSEWFKLRDEIANCTLECAPDPWRGECDPGSKQGIGWVGALYMTVVTASTVGYGDVTPHSALGKLVGIFYFPIAVALMSKTILAVSMIPTEYRQLKLEEYVLDQFGEQLNMADLEDLRQSVNLGEGEGMHKNDFTLAMLLRLGRVTKVDILRTEQVFYNLDKDHSGSLTKEDLHDLLATQRRRMAQARAAFANEKPIPVMPQHFTPKVYETS